jgi:hypothetical protein
MDSSSGREGTNDSLTTHMPPVVAVAVATVAATAPVAAAAAVAPLAVGSVEGGMTVVRAVSGCWRTTGGAPAKSAGVKEDGFNGLDDALELPAPPNG